MTIASRSTLIVFAFWATSTHALAADDMPGAGLSIQRTRALIGDAACDDDSQCRTIPVGTKACGGPEYYLAWSTKRTDAAALNAALQEDSAAQRLHIDRRGMRSDCRVVTDPGAYCAVSGGAVTDTTTGRSCRLHAMGYGGRVD